MRSPASPWAAAGCGSRTARGWALNFSSYQPALANFNDPNFTLRYDWIEAAITGSTDDNMNMTAVDKFSIPLSVEGYLSTNRAATTQVLKSELGRRVYSPLAAIAANPNAPAPTRRPSASPTLPRSPATARTS